jgi:hypothetical protein
MHAEFSRQFLLLTGKRQYMAWAGHFQQLLSVWGWQIHSVMNEFLLTLRDPEGVMPRGESRILTSSQANDLMPVLSPDGQEVFFAPLAAGAIDLQRFTECPYRNRSQPPELTLSVERRHNVGHENLYRSGFGS